MLALYMAVTHMRSVARQMGFLGKMWTKKGGSGGKGGGGKVEVGVDQAGRTQEVQDNGLLLSLIIIKMLFYSI